jgi:hypothetical protein
VRASAYRQLFSVTRTSITVRQKPSGFIPLSFVFPWNQK